MSELLVSLKSYFRTDYVIIDNNMCRLHHKGSVAILLAFSILVTAKQYIGDPIDCVAPKDSVDMKMLDTYCWIHKTFSVEKAFKGELDKEVAYPGVAPHKPGDKLVYHSYYQWVCFVLLLQAGAFYAPRFLWKLMEGHRVEHLSCSLTDPIVDVDQRDKQIKLLAYYMKVNKDKHKLYFGGMILVEILYFVNLILQMYIMDVFLGGEFSTYGWRVLTFSEWHWEARFDPMIKVFPRMAKCTFRMYGTSGDIQRLDAVCVLPINIINEKIYVFLWFWFVALTVVTAAWLVYRVATMMLPSMRLWLLLRRARPAQGPVHKDDIPYSPLAEDVLQQLIDDIDASDWFITYQIAKNIDPLHLKWFLTRYAARRGVFKAQKIVEYYDEERRTAKEKQDVDDVYDTDEEENYDEERRTAKEKQDVDDVYDTYEGENYD